MTETPELDFVCSGTWTRVSVSRRQNGRWEWIGTFNVPRPYAITRQMREAIKQSGLTAEPGRQSCAIKITTMNSPPLYYIVGEWEASPTDNTVYLWGSDRCGWSSRPLPVGRWEMSDGGCVTVISCELMDKTQIDEREEQHPGFAAFRAAVEELANCRVD